ncbi:ABC transporter permease [Paenibacillus lignilyticus]|uniref:ABC transporter permease n=1 Tax=Paenibacillus lignilyticus TaxID=1172615 RepID=A0ABS5CL68_9BACL|nr:ABC transporter permease [Paenibacillus lignilyticus]
MLNLIACEWLKWRNSRMLWLVLLGALLPGALGFFIQLNNSGAFEWGNLFENNLFILTMLMCPALFALLGGYLFAREFQERTVNNLLTGPHSRNQVLTAKFIIAIPVLFSVILLSFLLTFGTGFLFTSEMPTLAVIGEAVGKYGLLFVLEYALLPIAAAVALLWRSYIPAMGLGVFAVVSELTIMQSRFIMYYPWSVPLNLVTHAAPDYNNVSIGVTTMLIAFFVPLLFIAWYFRRSDVHSG